MKKVFLTGAAGFIGFHLARSLVKQGAHVVGYDNFNHYYSPQLKRSRAALLQKDGVEVLEADLSDRSQMEQAVDRQQTTHFVHLAAQAGVRYSIQDPQAYVKANIEGFLNVLEICRHKPGIKLIYASSSSVYGNNEKVPFAETDSVQNQASFYGVTKRANELMASTYHHLYKVPVTGLRFFTVYGPWGRPDMAYFSFTEAILQGKPIELYEGGRLKRDFTYIDDIIEGTIAAINLGASHEVFNLGHHDPVEVRHFVSILEKLLGRKAKVIEKPMQAGDVVKTYADIQHSHQRLGFVPKVSLEEGLSRFVDWHRSWSF